MAWRNVWRNRRRTLVTIAAMSLGLLTMILYAGLVEGYIIGLERNVLDLELGDIQIHADDYRRHPSLYKKIDRDDEILADLDDAGYPASARLLGTGLAAAGDSSSGVALRGLDPARDAAVSKVSQHVQHGQWLDPADPRGVVIGRRLAKILAIDVGDEFVVLGQGADGSMANEMYNVRGILKSIADGVDRSGIYMTAAAFRELMVLPEGAHQIVVRRPTSVELPQATEHVVSAAAELDVQNWKQLTPTVAKMLESTRAAMMAMYAVIYVVIGILILNAMLMAVFERVREFGVLKAIGVGPGHVFRLILAEAAVMTSVAVLVGVGLAIPGLLYLQDTGLDLTSYGDMSIAGIAWDPVMRAVINENTFVGPVVAMLFIIGLAVIYPALRAAMITPVEAMRHR